MRRWVGVIVLPQFCLWAWSAATQPVHSAADPDALIDAKRMEIRHHTEKLQSVSDAAAFQRETQTHFGLVEELMGLIIAQQRQARGSANAAPNPSMPMMTGKMAMPCAAPIGQVGVMGDDAMELPAESPSSAVGSGMKGEMGMASAPTASTQPEMMSDNGTTEMPTVSPQGGAMAGSMMGATHGERGMGSGSSMTGAVDAAKRLADREALLAEMTRHSQYLASLSDAEARSRELLRHQEMLDRLLELMR